MFFPAKWRETDVAKCCHGVWDHFAHQANPLLFFSAFFGPSPRFPTVTSLLMDQLMCHGGSHPATISELVDASSVYNLGSVDSSSQGPDHGN